MDAASQKRNTTMTTTPTPEQLCALASEVTGFPHIVGHGNIVVLAFDKHGHSSFVSSFEPLFDGDDWQQAQALQVVVWISKRMEGIDPADVTECTACKLAKIMAHEDTAALLSLGVELLEK